MCKLTGIGCKRCSKYNIVLIIVEFAPFIISHWKNTNLSANSEYWKTNHPLGLISSYASPHIWIKGRRFGLQEEKDVDSFG